MVLNRNVSFNFELNKEEFRAACKAILFIVYELNLSIYDGIEMSIVFYNVKQNLRLHYPNYYVSREHRIGLIASANLATS